MGTRSLTYVYDSYTDKNGKTKHQKIINMYRQFDGYPTGHGIELAQFLNSFDAIVNGYAHNEVRKVANGMGCLSAQMVANFKDGVGGFYLYPTKCTDCGQDYEYHVYEGRVVVKETGWGDIKTKKIFDGSWKDFLQFCTKQDY